MSSYIVTDAVVLQRQSFRETDRRVVLYTKESGKVDAVVRGARKLSSKLAGHTEPFSVVQVMLARGCVFDHVAGSVVRDPLLHLRKNFSSFVCTSFIGEITSRLIKPEEKDERMYTLLVEALKEIDHISQVHESALTHWWQTREGKIATTFAWRLLILLGYKPELEFCMVCKQSEQQASPSFFDCAQGGYLCVECVRAAPPNNRYTITPASLTMLKDLSQKQQELDIGDYETQKQVIAIVLRYLIHHLERPLYTSTSFRYSMEPMINDL